MEHNPISLFKGYADTRPTEVTLKNIVELIRNDEKAKMIQDLEARLRQQESQLREMEAKSSRTLKELEAKLKAKETAVSENKRKSDSSASSAEKPKKGK